MKEHKGELIALYRRCHAYGVKPSDEMGFTAPWLKWSFDETVYSIAAIIDTLNMERDKKGRPVHRFSDLLVGKLSGSAEDFILAFGGAQGKIEGF